LRGHKFTYLLTYLLAVQKHWLRKRFLKCLDDDNLKLKTRHDGSCVACGLKSSNWSWSTYIE